MTERGVFAVARALWSDPDFADEPFTEREAFVWLVGEAAWKKHRARGHHGPLVLERGEFCMAVRFMAEAWSWSKSRVARFLGRLENKGILRDTSRDNEKVYSIRNYNKFQVLSLPERDDNRDLSGTTAGQQRDKLEYREYKEKNTDVSAREVSDSEEQALVEAAGESLSTSPSLFVMADPMKWKAAGVSIALDAVPAIRAAAAKCRSGSVSSWKYFEQPVADFHARRTAQMPPGNILPIQNRSKPRSGPQEHMDAIREIRREFGNREDSDDFAGPTIETSFARAGA